MASAATLRAAFPTIPMISTLRFHLRTLARPVACGALLACATTLPAADDPKDAKPKEEAKDKEKDKDGEAKETKSVTESEVTVGGQKIAYTATAGTLPLTKAYGEPRASVFYVSYERKNAGDGAKRPVTFCFNGGPGSSSVWLHLGAFGPRRVVLPADGVSAPKPPYEMAPNEHSLLDVTDLVFIDPVSTGFSRAEKGEDAKQFHGYNEDLESVGEFIRRWVSKNNRWTSPKYVAGESYGGLRAAGLAGHLQDRYGMYLNGVVIVSGVVDFKTLSADAGNDIPYLSFFPSMAAVAHYHRKLAPELLARPVEDIVKEAQTLAFGPYAAALLRGHAVTAEETQKLAADLSRLSGLPADYWVRQRLRVSASEFRRKLLEAENKVVGRFDARALVDVAGEDDPSYTNVYGAYATMLNAYVRGDLKYESDLSYEILTGAVQPWNYSAFTNRYVNASAPLGEALTANPSLRVFVACGHYDFATPAAGIHFTVNHLPTDPTRLGAVEFKHYEGGHMMYTIAASLEALNRDIRAFIAR